MEKRMAVTRLRSKFLVSTTFLAILWAFSTALCADPATHDAARQLAGRALGSTPMINDLEELCDGVGGRPTGSPACDRAVEWAVAKFRAAGLDVTVEPFTVPALWLGGSTDSDVTVPERFPLRLAAAPYTPSTQGAIEARLVDAGDGSSSAFEKLGGGAHGAVALVHTHVLKTFDDLFAEYNMDAPMLAAAQKAAVAAILFESSRPCGQLYRHPMTGNSVMAPLPVAVVARDHAERLARLAAHSEVRVRLTLANKTGEA